MTKGVASRAEHLMDDESFKGFTGRMWMELELHRLDKTPIRDWELVDVWKLTKDEIVKRTEILKTRGPDDMEKQCIHMANYLYFLWTKLQMTKKEKSQ